MRLRKSRGDRPIRTRESNNRIDPPSATVAVTLNNTSLQSSALSIAPQIEDKNSVASNIRSFKLLELPSELREKVYEFYFLDSTLIIDLDPDNYKNIHRKFSLFMVSKQIHDESSHYFYSTRTIRLFPTHFRWFFMSRRPLLSRLPPRYREMITSLELRFGPGFTNPPKGWVVNDALGLRDATRVRVLHVYVEIDTSNSMYEGFRRSEDGFFEGFCRDLQHQVLLSLPSIVEVQFDGYQSVLKHGNMMNGLVENVIEHQKLISWGPERRWGDEDGEKGDIG